MGASAMEDAARGRGRAVLIPNAGAFRAEHRAFRRRIPEIPDRFQYLATTTLGITKFVVE